MMNKQIKLYSINLGMVKTDIEKQLYRMKYINDSSLYNYKKKISKEIKKELNVNEWTEECSNLFKKTLKNDNFYKVVNAANKNISKLIKDEIIKFDSDGIRTVDSKYFKDVNVIAFFDNALTRTLEIKADIPTLDFIVIEVGNTDMSIVKQVIENGLIITERIKTGETEDDIDKIEVKNNKYKFFTAGAGQTRQKKFMMIKEDVWNTYEKNLMCGLTIDYINKMGGMNINKFNAYLSLNNSASEVVEGFDIDRCIVVDDFTELINEEVDYITRNDEASNGETSYITKKGKEVIRKKKKTEWNIKRQFMDVPIDFMDGTGICLSEIFKKNTQVRLPWFKGILCPVNYKKYITENSLKTKVTDIFGKEYDIIKDNIKVIFTKSQFKMWKYYKNILDKDGNLLTTGWEIYKNYYKYYKCTCNKCLEDEDKLKNMKINYQMLQTLTEMTDNDIEKLTKPTKDLINKIHIDRDEQLKFLGATLDKKHRDYVQEIIRLYPEILSSKYIKKQLKDTITSYKKEAKSGRIEIKAKRVFIIPDLIHFMSLLFGDGKDYALGKGEVYFNTYKDSKRLALLRSPHLSREWSVNKNVESNKKTKYFKTNAIYVNAKDLMSKVLMCDWDGDEALIVEDCEDQKWLLDLAERQMSDLRPLYYEMGGGDSNEINTINTFKSLKFVYEKSNIGKVSNTLTNIWSKDDCESKSDEIKKLCAYNNWIIDSAKKLELPKLPKNVKELMNNSMYPYFFQFAKNKKKNECRPMGNGVIDRICKSIDSIENENFDYSNGFGKFKLNTLLNNKKIQIDYGVIDFYKKLEENTRLLIRKYALKYKDEAKFNYKELAYREARKDVRWYANNNNIDYLDIVDMIIKYSFNEDEMKLAFVFNVFGAVIINNINKNIKLSIDKGNIMCKCCGERVKNNKSSNRKYCDNCKDNVLKEQKKLWKLQKLVNKSF